jgi:hypothetical protein
MEEDAASLFSLPSAALAFLFFFFAGLRFELASAFGLLLADALAFPLEALVDLLLAAGFAFLVDFAALADFVASFDFGAVAFLICLATALPAFLALFKTAFASFTAPLTIFFTDVLAGFFAALAFDVPALDFLAVLLVAFIAFAMV